MLSWLSPWKFRCRERTSSGNSRVRLAGSRCGGAPTGPAGAVPGPCVRRRTDGPCIDGQSPAMGTRWRIRLTERAFWLLAAVAVVAVAHAQDAARLHARQTALFAELASSPFQRPLVIESTQADGALKGDVYAVVAHPYSVVGPALQGM